MQTRQPFAISARAYFFVACCLGCSSAADNLEETRVASSAAYSEAVSAFNAKDYAKAEQSLNVALQPGGLMSDQYCDAVVKRAVCMASSGKVTEAAAELENLGLAATNLDALFAAKAYVLAKQGKTAESRAALAKARQYNRTVQEFKD